MIDLNNLERDLKLIREVSPLIINLTNDVVMNFNANALLAIGASPIMIQEIEEVEEIIKLSSALVLNIGTIHESQLKLMIVAGKAALEKMIPIILDPVGVGITNYRTLACEKLIKECKPSIIKGNASEIAFLCGIDQKGKGVDSMCDTDIVIKIAKEKAGKIVYSISGTIDYVTDGERVLAIKNGTKALTRITGTGCTVSALTAAFAAVNNDMVEAAAHALLIMSIAGEIADKNSEGVGSFQMNLLDQLSKIDIKIIRDNIK